MCIRDSDIAPQKMLSGLELNENVNRGNFIFYDEDQTFSAENFVLAIHNKKEENVSYLQPKQMLKSQNDNTLSFAANRIILFLKIFVQIVDKMCIRDSLPSPRRYGLCL